MIRDNHIRDYIKLKVFPSSRSCIIKALRRLSDSAHTLNGFATNALELPFEQVVIRFRILNSADEAMPSKKEGNSIRLIVRTKLRWYSTFNPSRRFLRWHVVFILKRGHTRQKIRSERISDGIYAGKLWLSCNMVKSDLLRREPRTEKSSRRSLLTNKVDRSTKLGLKSNAGLRSLVTSSSKMFVRSTAKGPLHRSSIEALSSIEKGSNKGAFVKWVVESNQEIKRRIRSRKREVGRRIHNGCLPLRNAKHGEITNRLNARGPFIHASEFKKPVRVFGSTQTNKSGEIVGAANKLATLTVSKHFLHDIGVENRIVIAGEMK